ncbi:MAG: 16S rRNA (cytosine(1402)-N(4))-methyltransferase RsmH [Ferruginibacter sp.]|nr:16S rRNA (cytosine(1402)-N(4))-methyltransferase RsmH [Bacteroidota bacterium]MBX2917601.1 16S rRNA (cytosine(1402)-N(4))-methyltransferase RsmH [Ferruginibacter sp.]MCB0709066.1 16S rRNA (cytosine(1402)-N(4))-methyltransferase RsmH [Chitinophagaceae bacterium]MCC7379579.1 16S rRNA (cytosine(1402)-N(4))-methyltransferase RsmH [Chitinophagaceae bacterium]
MSNKKSNIQVLNPQSTNYHTPVLLNECLTALNIKSNGVYVDCTFGGGGHSRAILQQLDNNGRLIVFDQDEDARKNLPGDERVVFVPHNFRHLKRFLRLHKFNKVDGILADLGVSSHQLDVAERGFSTRFDATLDMRMDQRQTITAAEILKTFSEVQLHKMFEQFGEVTNAKTLAKTIIVQREVHPIRTINELKTSVQAVVKGNPNKYFAQVFQALRIQVNDELGALKELLEQSADVLNRGGRIAIITFHSLEDRLVKNFFKYGTFEDTLVDDVYGHRFKNPLKLVTKKPIIATTKELNENTRSRSAKLRVAEKLDE